MKTTEKNVEAVASKRADRRRLQLDFSPDAFKRLSELKKMAHAETNTEVLRNALRLYEWFLTQKSDEYKIQLAKGDEVKEIEFVF